MKHAPLLMGSSQLSLVSRERVKGGRIVLVTHGLELHGSQYYFIISSYTHIN